MIGDAHIVVTGGVSELGLAISERLLDEGARVSVLDLDGVGVEVCTERFAGEDIMFIQCDVSDEDEVADAFAQAVAEMGSVAGLVNCAALRQDLPFERVGTELFRQMIDVNLTGTFITCKAALDEMEDRLAIVNFSASAASHPEAGRAAFGAGRAGVELMSRVMAQELAGSGVRVNVVAPVLQDPSAEGGAEVDRQSRRASMAAPSLAEIAAAVLFLLSDDSAGVNGHVLAVGAQGFG